MTETTGPDVAEIQCYTPDGCCAPSPCGVTEDEFLCAVRALLPEGDIFNNTKHAQLVPPRNVGAGTIGCANVGCEQLVIGGCCEDEPIPCTDTPYAPQLAVVDSFSA